MSDLEICNKCNGLGEIKVIKREYKHILKENSTYIELGEGYNVQKKEICPVCNGKGLIDGKENN